MLDVLIDLYKQDELHFAELTGLNLAYSGQCADLEKAIEFARVCKEHEGLRPLRHITICSTRPDTRMEDVISELNKFIPDLVVRHDLDSSVSVHLRCRFWWLNNLIL